MSLHDNPTRVHDAIRETLAVLDLQAQIEAELSLLSALAHLPEWDPWSSPEWDDRVELGPAYTREQVFEDTEDEDWNEYDAWLARVDSYPKDF